MGGKSSIHASVEHHGKHIANSRIFVKFNAKEFPGKDTSVYDARIQADAEGHAIINCYKGEYFLYGMGFDAGVPGKVSGGLHVKVRTNEEIHTEVPVTED